MIFSMFAKGVDLALELAIRDEETRKKAIIAADAAIAAAAVVGGDAGSAIAEGIEAGGKTAKLATHDRELAGIIDHATSVASTAGGAFADQDFANVLELTKSLGGAAAGGVAGLAADDGKLEGLGTGLESGFQIGRGSWLASGEKLAGAGAGAAIAAGASGGRDRRAAVEFGLSYGTGVGGGAASLTEFIANDGMDEMGGSIVKVIDAAHSSGVASLTAKSAGLVAAGVVHADRSRARDDDIFATAQQTTGVADAAASVTSLAHDPSKANDPPAGKDAAASVTSPAHDPSKANDPPAEKAGSAAAADPASAETAGELARKARLASIARAAEWIAAGARTGGTIAKVVVDERSAARCRVVRELAQHAPNPRDRRAARAVLAALDSERADGDRACALVSAAGDFVGEAGQPPKRKRDEPAP